ncbi:hypothetical protein SLS53_004973 [Cytospora paraplurivora]|uniref:Major facilitator superfamily (MFS) profile domain-containing protein n=1 Tax=Cytospora paraplurivora TaxID=2898453 RepID=A0AAN9U960_9PEZI
MSSAAKEPESKEADLDIAMPTVSLESRPDQDSQEDTRTGRRIITENEAWEHTAYAYTPHRKWSILLVLWMIQIAMNMNGSIWANTEAGQASYYGMPINKVSLGNMTFLISYAFGCEIWAPWSEELGRKWLMQASLLLVSILTACVPFAPNFGTVIVLRLLTGLATAGGSLTLGVVADMYKANDQQNAVAFVAWGSMLGSSLPPMVGGIMEYHIGADSRRWCFWLISLSGVFVAFWHLIFVPETYYKKALNKCAKQRREKSRMEGNESLEDKIYGPTEDIPLNTVGLIILGFFNRRNAQQRAADPNSEDAQYEGRLSSLCWTAWCLACGLTIFAATANPAYGHYAWIGTGIGVFFIGIANYVIYASTIDYMVAAYGFYAASATGGNGFARDFLAGVLTPVGKLWIEDMGPQAMCGILAGFSFLFFLACILVRLKGPLLRRRSKYTVKEANPNARQIESLH